MKNPRRPPFRVPEWSRDAVWYQIFPERFRNGDPRNDPRAEDFGPVGPPPPRWRVTPWGRQWYAREPWEKGRPFWDTVFHRRYGGDLAGIREKLGYLRDLGVNALYLNPVFHAPSLHKYDASSLHHIDPSLGPDREGDLRAIERAGETEDPATWIWTAADRYFLELLADARRHGLRVIVDGVFNHTGRDFFAFRDLLRHGHASPCRDWYRIDSWNPDGSFAARGWFGHASLPELARTEDDLAPPVKRYLYDITRRWMAPDGDPSCGVDGWRLDVAFCVPHGFWRDWRRLVKSIRPDAFLTAEIVDRADAYLQGDEFDSVMNYAGLFPVMNFFAPRCGSYSAADFRAAQDELRRAYPAACQPALQNLLDSHDVGRAVSVLENLREPVREFAPYFALARAHDRPEFFTGRPSDAAWRALRQAVVFQMTFTGAPMIYYGSEAGMWGANDPCNRQPMPWDDQPAADETLGLHGPAPRAARRPDKALRAFYRKAIALRRRESALRRGTLRWIETGHDRLLGFERAHRERRIRVLFNASDRPLHWHLPEPARDLWTGRATPAGSVRIPPRRWRILATPAP